jgi:hypothetical protein
MTAEDAFNKAIGYAWGREDASGVKTAEKDGLSGCYRFAEAFRDMYADFNAEKRCWATNTRSAYDRWQETYGETIEPAS